MFTFIHAADIHLDSPLRGLDRYAGAPAEQIRGATRRALENLVDLALREEVAFVLLGGDLYDGDWRDFNTGLFFVQQMTRLREASIPVYGVLGNHDAASRITRRLPLPDNVHFFPTDAAATVHVDHVDVAIHGQSFAKQCTTADLAKDYPTSVSGCFNIGVLHTSMSGREGHASYAPCSEACLRDRGYDYWALGHIHRREVLGGTSTIAYPGNPQGRHIREAGAKGCLVVQVDDALEITAEFEPLDVLRWQVAEVPLETIDHRDELLAHAQQAIQDAVEQSDGRLAAVRVVLSGETPIAESLAAERRQLAAELRALAVDQNGDQLWIEKIKLKAALPSERRSSYEDETPRAEVGQLIEQLRSSNDPAGELDLDLSELKRKLPAELAEAVRPDDAQWWQEILQQAEPRLLAALRG